MTRALLIVFLIFFQGKLTFGQTGPGGVGSSTTMSMWIRADADVFSDVGVTPATNGSTVRQINDQSGNGRNAFQATAGSRPFYRAVAQNGKPGLRFTGNLFIDGPALGIASTSSYTYIMAFKDTVSSPGGMNDGSGIFMLDRTSGTNELVSLKQINPGTTYGFQKRNNAGGGLGGPVTTTTINSNAKSIQMLRNYNTNYLIYYNGSLQNTLTAGDGATTPPNPRIGRHTNTTNGGIRGYIYEFVIYNVALNSAQTIIVNNYLGAKYGYALSANDIYIQDNVANGNFDHDVAGIGRVDASNQQLESQGTGRVRVLNASGLGNNEFFIWGHDNGALDAFEYTDIPATLDARMQRVWRVSEVNASGTAVDVGSIEMRFDLSGLGSITASDLRLLVDTDNDGVFNDETPIAGASLVSGSIYAFIGVTEISNNLRFTLGTIDSAQTPLPIELSSFTAKHKDECALLEWTTESETNNNYFDITRSTDGQFWESIGQVEGAGNSNERINYNFLDEAPFSGISYYQLVQVDFDGQSFKSNIEQFESRRASNDSRILISPNPASDVLEINFQHELKAEWSLTDMLGVVHKPIIITETETKLLIDVSALASGTYIISVGSENARFIKND